MLEKHIEELGSALCQEINENREQAQKQANKVQNLSEKNKELEEIIARRDIEIKNLKGKLHETETENRTFHDLIIFELRNTLKSW